MRNISHIVYFYFFLKPRKKSRSLVINTQNLSNTVLCIPNSNHNADKESIPVYFKTKHNTPHAEVSPYEKKVKLYQVVPIRNDIHQKTKIHRGDKWSCLGERLSWPVVLNVLKYNGLDQQRRPGRSLDWPHWTNIGRGTNITQIRPSLKD